MAPTSENLIAMLPDDPFEISLSVKDLDNSCETYFYCSGSPQSPRTAIPEASPIFRRALGTMNKDDDDDPNFSASESDDDDTDDQFPSLSISSSLKGSLYSSSSSTSSSPKSSPPRTGRTSNPIPAPRNPRKSVSPKFLSVPSSSSVPTDLSTPCKADLSDSGAHNTLAGVALRKGCTRKAASFGGCDLVKPDSQRYEKKVSWADERGSKHQLIHVRLIRPRLAANTNDGTLSTPGHSILRCSESCSEGDQTSLSKAPKINGKSKSGKAHQCWKSQFDYQQCFQ